MFAYSQAKLASNAVADDEMWCRNQALSFSANNPGTSNLLCVKILLHDKNTYL
jgi:hypothetical protein